LRFSVPPLHFHARALFRTSFRRTVRRMSLTKGNAMTRDVSDVQAALLYDAVPQVDMQRFMAWFAELAQSHGLPGPYTRVPTTQEPESFAFAGHGVTVSIALNTQPLSKKAFALSLRAPILKQKTFDFKAAIENHTAGIVITVADGDILIPRHLRQDMAAKGALDAVDRLVKLKILHVALQAINSMTRAKVIDFCPSQSLLTVPELMAVSHMGLPVPLLFHPFPVRNAPHADGHPRRGMAAIHAPLLIGTELELEAIPHDLPLQASLGLLSELIMQKLDGQISLEDGETVVLNPSLPGARESDGAAFRLWIRHEDGATQDGPKRVIASFDTRASQPDTKAPTGGHQAFQDRIARLKQRGHGSVSELGSDHTPASDGHIYKESADDLRERVQDTIGMTASGETETRRSGGFGVSKFVAVAGAVGCYFIFTQVGGEDGSVFRTQTEAGSLVAELLSGPAPISISRVSAGGTP